jgi:RPA family protein
MTARKVLISELMTGQWVKKEGMEPSFVTTKNGENISRARILATVISKFQAEDGNFGSITLDDSSDTIRAKTFKTVEPISDLEIGSIVDVTGKVREYNEEIYIIPEVIRNVNDPNFELLRKLEIARRLADIKSGKAKPNINTEAEAAMEAPEAGEDDKETLRKKVLTMIESNPDGVNYNEISEGMSAKETELESVINDLLAEGICFEPTPGKIKKI